jgi:hypothetical protein
MPASSERFVRTKDVRAAAKGRESDILDALGIAWRNGRPHIPCPYPDHDDRNPSWRFDARTGRAFCTCIIDGKSDGIFDVVMKMKAADFDAAKIIVAELLYRDDLIKTTGGGAGQKTDPQSLLNPPADNRDDEILRRYLAARLGIAPDQVLLPSTKTAGIVSLAYFDAPLKNGKPVLVGHWPCCVFETIAADGRQHAHRIYVNADGTGKAELGQDVRGRDRDPKKSARRDPNGPSTAGCCVVWGNPDIEYVILAEGIENGAAVAASFCNEIANGEVAVLSAITAGGIEAFVPWPATRRITVAADRDEAKPSAGFKRGEKAARNLALRLAQGIGDGEQTVWRNADHDLPVTRIGEPELGPDGRMYQQIQYRDEPPSYVPADELHTTAGRRQLEVLIALPGQPGTAYDFLNLFRDTDPDRVRNIVFTALPFRPTAKEIAEFEQRGWRQSKIEEIAAAFPLPPLIGLRVEYRYTETEEIWLYRLKDIREDRETGERTEIWEAVSSPFGNFVLLLSVGEHPIHGLRGHVRTATGAVDTVDFMRAELPKLGASGVRSAMMAAGVRVANGGEMTIVEILKQIQPGDFIQTTAALGWDRAGNDRVFLTPGGKRSEDYGLYLRKSAAAAKADNQ